MHLPFLVARVAVAVLIALLAGCAVEGEPRPPLGYPGSCCVATFPPGTLRDQRDAVACVARHVVEGCQRIDCVEWSAWVCADGAPPVVLRPYPGGTECTCEADE